ncbi:MAG: hypothetical protein JWO81_175 [Alphaproteobacteria bacterium]|nr:hypothetical protein [Alphaproteobacteria bacterium]
MVRPEPGAAAPPLLIERILRRDTIVVGACLLAAATLAWGWLVFGMAAAAVPSQTGGMAAMAATAAVDPWGPAYLGAAFAMWALMMVAMMLPSASPMILLYTRFAVRSGGAALAGTAVFALTYAAIWLLFSACAALLQAGLVSAGIVSRMALALGDRRLEGALLLLTGAWQLSPWKEACLAACRSPLSFLMRLWRPGVAGAVRLGLAHGTYCLGCCWAIMLLLFVGGVMNLAWIAGLAALVLAERFAPVSLRKALAIALLLAGAAVALL